MFLTYDTVFPHGATADDLLRITRPRPGLPFTRGVLGGRPRLLWTTFTPHQIDLDVHHPPPGLTCRGCSAAWRSAG